MNKQILNNAVFSLIIAIICLILLAFFNYGCASIMNPEDTFTRINNGETKTFDGIRATYIHQERWVSPDSTSLIPGGEFLRYSIKDDSGEWIREHQIGIEPNKLYENIITFRTGNVTDEFAQIRVE